MDKLTNAACGWFKAEFNVYLMHTNYVNAHLSDLRCLRDLSVLLPQLLQMFIGYNRVNCHGLDTKKSFTDPEVNESLINEILNVIHSTFTIKVNKTEQMEI